jgi:2-haloacid dehalogenase
MTIKAFVFDAYGTLYDVQSVAGVTDAAFPGHGDYITQAWRMKQLEYTWLRSLMGAYEDFWSVTRASLAYTLKTLGLEATPELFEKLADAYNNLQPYPDARAALESLAAYDRAILSNGSPAMLGALVANSGFDDLLKAVLSVDAKGVFKPDPRSYELVEDKLGVAPDEVVFVSSNGFDVAGAKAFGFRVARIERVSPAALREELAAPGTIAPRTMFKALRMQPEALGFDADWTVSSLSDLKGLIASESRLG